MRQHVGRPHELARRERLLEARPDAGDVGQAHPLGEKRRLLAGLDDEDARAIGAGFGLAELDRELGDEAIGAAAK